jgi:hypothetical protein
MKQAAQHTPGPWKLCRNAHGWFLKTKAGCIIGGINRFPDTAELAYHCESNARLIAAAPDLLEALKGLQSVGYLDDSSCATKEGAAALRAARSALAKAGAAA